MKLNTNTALTELLDLIGLNDTIELLEVALPVIDKHSNELHAYLKDKNWLAAAKVAHKMLSSAHLYSSDVFVTHLQQIHDMSVEIISSEQFQEELQQEFADTNEALSAWLKSHNVKHIHH